MLLTNITIIHNVQAVLMRDWILQVMVEETGGNQSAASKGSSPDMEDYEVIATESKDPAAEVGSEIHPEQDARITSTTAENESKDSTWNLEQI